MLLYLDNVIVFGWLIVCLRVVEKEREELGREFFFQAVLAGAQGGG